MNKRDKKILAKQDALARLPVGEQAAAYAKMLRIKPTGRPQAFIHAVVQKLWGAL